MSLPSYKDIATRFKLSMYYFKDVSTRFRLAMPGAYKDVATRFFLYQPTWMEIEIQHELTDLRAQIIEALKPKAHFEI